MGKHTPREEVDFVQIHIKFKQETMRISLQGVSEIPLYIGEIHISIILEIPSTLCR